MQVGALGARSQTRQNHSACGRDSVRIAQALEAGVIDAVVLDRALTARLKRKGFSVVAEFYRANTPLSRNGLVVTRAYLQEKWQVLEKMLGALVEGIAFSLAPGNKAVVVKTMMKHLRIDDPGLAEQGYQDVLLSVSQKPYPSIEGVRNMQRLMALYNPKMASVRAEDLVDSSFVSKLDESGLMDRLLRAYGPQ